jgi:hypothetical protein
LWLGDTATLFDVAPSLGRAGSLAVTALAFFGLCKVWLDRLRGGDRQALALPSCVLAIALVPLLVLARDSDHSYQFYKLLLTVSPLLVLGLVLLGQRPPGAPAGPLLGRVACLVPLTVVFVLAAVGTTRMVWSTVDPTSVYRCNAPLLRSRDVLALQRLLPRLPADNLVMAFQGPSDGLLQSWVSYFARRHRIWMTSPRFLNHAVWEAHAARVGNLEDLPRDTLLLTGNHGIRATDIPGATPVWQGDLFALWRVGGAEWAILTVNNPNGLEGAHNHPMFWLGKDGARVEVLARRPGEVCLKGHFAPGPSLPETTRRRLHLCGPGYDTTFETCGGEKEFRFLVPAGRSTFTLECLDRATVASLPNGEARTLLVQVVDLTYRYRPTTERGSPAATAGASRQPGQGTVARETR